MNSEEKINYAREKFLKSIKKLGYFPGTSVCESSLPSVLESFAEQRKEGNIEDYLVISFAEQTGDSKKKGHYEIFLKR